MQKGGYQDGELRAALGGLCALLTGLGLARFAYTPLLPALIEAGWLDAPAAAYLGAANFAGYLAGALAARRLGVLLPTPLLLRATMLATTASLLACALPLGFWWMVPWRTLAGFTGAVLTVVAAPAALARIAGERRARAAGIVFTGAGIGIVGSGTLVPVLVAQGGVTLSWLGIAAVAGLLTLLSWRNWSPSPLRGTAPAATTRIPDPPTLRAIGIYALAALGLVPHMVFLVDYAARGLGQGLAAGSGYWVIFGVGAAMGPLLAGRLADRVGFARALQAGVALQVVAAILPVLAPGTLTLVVSSLAMGIMTPGSGALVLGRMGELRGPEGQAAGWGVATTSFAIFQAAGAWAMSWLYAATDSYAPLFLAATAALVLGLALSLVDGPRRRELSRRS
ncbi:YbfB/YjiJ family MFS transporter [Marinimicrococcus flavescens]|uniref:YbfB/YjiJ family MFS transporter n=1 Tax=Marinimicrococcus flavescens TaxID=3031815 RepID=A0AAP3XSY2_9PROT|nr:YbfB/YjiJ family MFS transporter [Marinimicrococcus flavescens]